MSSAIKKEADKVKAGTVESSTWQILTLSGTEKIFRYVHRSLRAYYEPHLIHHPV